MTTLITGEVLDTDNYENHLDTDLFATFMEVITALYYNDLLMLEDDYALEENIMKVLMGNFRFMAEAGHTKNTAPVLLSVIRLTSMSQQNYWLTNYTCLWK